MARPTTASATLLLALCALGVADAGTVGVLDLGDGARARLEAAFAATSGAPTVVSARCATPEECAAAAESLLASNSAEALFGALPADFVEAVEPVAAAAGARLFTSTAQPGDRCNASVAVGAAVPNQNLEPAVDWLAFSGAKNVHVVGTAGAYERVPVEAVLAARGLALTGESWVARGAVPTVDAAADAVLSYLERNDSLAYFAAGAPKPTVALLLTDADADAVAGMAGHHLAVTSRDAEAALVALWDSEVGDLYSAQTPRIAEAGGADVWEAGAALAPVVWSHYAADTRGRGCDAEDVPVVGVVHAVWGADAAVERAVQATELLHLEGSFAFAFPSTRVASAADAAAAAAELLALDGVDTVVGAAGNWSAYDSGGQACAAAGHAHFGAVPSLMLEPALDWLTWEHRSTAAYHVRHFAGAANEAAVAAGYLAMLGCAPASEAELSIDDDDDFGAGLAAGDVVVLAVDAYNATQAAAVVSALGADHPMLVAGLTALAVEQSLSLRSAAAAGLDVTFATTYYAESDALTAQLQSRFAGLSALVGSGELQAASAAAQALALGAEEVTVDEGTLVLGVHRYASRAHARLSVAADGLLALEHQGAVRQADPLSQHVAATAGWTCDADGEAYEFEVAPLSLVQSLSGANEAAGRSMLQAELMAVEQINALGGVVGARVVAAVADGASDADAMAAQLLLHANVTAAVGGETSLDRVRMAAAAEAADQLLLSPSLLAGDECHANVLYMGGNGNMHVPVGVNWAMWELGLRGVILSTSGDSDGDGVDDDGGYSAVLSTAVETYLDSRFWGDIVATANVNLTAPDVPAAVAALTEAAGADDGAVLYVLSEDRAVVREAVALAAALPDPALFPVVTFALDELDLEHTNATEHVYSLKGYFESVSQRCADVGIISNEGFVADFAARFGEGRRLFEAAEAAFAAVLLWGETASRSGGWDDVGELLAAAYDSRLYSPSGSSTLKASHQMSRYSRIGRPDGAGGFEILLSTDTARDQQPWNFFNPAQGLSLFECDHSDSAVGSKGELDVIDFGVLTSITGADAERGRRDVRWVVAALAGFNTAGGILSSSARPIVIDCESDASVCATKVAAALAAGVVDVFMSALPYPLRAEVQPLLDAAGALTWHFAPNRQPVCTYYALDFYPTPSMLIPTAVDYLGSRGDFYVVDEARAGVEANYYAETAEYYIAQDSSLELRGSTLFLNASQPGAMDALMDDIAAALPDGGAILNLVDSDATNRELFAALAARGFSAALWPVMSTGLAEYLLQDIPAAYVDGHFATAAYVSSIGSSSNNVFKNQMRAIHGEADLVKYLDNRGAIAYAGARMFKKVAEGVRTTSSTRIASAITQQSRMDSAMGRLAVAKDHYLGVAISVAAIGGGEFQLKSTTGTLTAAPFWDLSGDVAPSAQNSYGSCDHAASCAAGTYGVPLEGCDLCPEGTYREASHADDVCTDCDVGSVTTGTRTYCQVCEVNFFSFDNKNVSCDVCPDHASCAGQTMVVPDEGYWHSSNTSVQLHKCLGDESCSYGNRSTVLAAMRAAAAASEDLDFSAYLAAQCSDGYSGPLCGSCEDGWGRTSGLACSRCSDSAAPIAFFSVLVLSMLAVLVVGIRSAIGRKKTRHQMKHNHIMKITVSFVQFTAVLREVDFRWPARIGDILEANGMAVMTTTFTSMDCVLDQDGLAPELQKAIVYFCLPFVVVAFFFVAWTAFCAFKVLFKKDLPRAAAMDWLTERWLVSANVTVFVLWPSVVFRVLALFNCEVIDERHSDTKYYAGLHAEGRFLVDDTSIECYTGDHQWALDTVGYPGMLIFCFLVPAVSVFGVYRHRKALDTDAVRRRYGFIFYSYNDSHYYWEGVIMLRKLCMAAVAVFFRNEVNVQILVALAVGLLSLLAQWLARPFGLESLNRLETQSLCCVLVLLYFGQYLYIEALSNSLLAVLSVLLALIVGGQLSWLCFTIFVAWTRKKIDRNGDGTITVEEFEYWAQRRLGNKLGGRFFTWYMSRVSSMPAAMQRQLMPVHEAPKPRGMLGGLAKAFESRVASGQRAVQEKMQEFTNAVKVKRRSFLFGKNGAKRRVRPSPNRGGPAMLGHVGRRHSLTDATDPLAIAESVEERRRNSRSQVSPADAEGEDKEGETRPAAVDGSDSDDDGGVTDDMFMTESELLARREQRARSKEGKTLVDINRRRTEIEALKQSVSRSRSNSDAGSAPRRPDLDRLAAAPMRERSHTGDLGSAAAAARGRSHTGDLGSMLPGSPGPGVAGGPPRRANSQAPVTSDQIIAESDDMIQQAMAAAAATNTVAFSDEED